MSALDRWHWQVRQAMPYLLLLLCIAVGAGMVWLGTLIGIGGEVSERTEALPPRNEISAPLSPSPVSNKETQQPVAKADKVAALELLEGFVETYYGRSAELYVGSTQQTLVKHRNAVAPFATDAFLSDYVTPLDSRADRTLEKQGVIVRASVVQDSIVGHFDDGNSGEATFTMKFTLVRNGRTIQSYRADAQITFVFESGEWQVATIQELE